MANTPPRKRSNIISLITLMVILLTFGYYYFYYIPYKKAQFTEQAFRIIERVSLNVKAKTANYQRIIDNTLKNINLKSISYASSAQWDLDRKLKAVDFPEELRLVRVNPYHEDSLMAGQRINFVNEKLQFTYTKQKASEFFQAVFEYDGNAFFPNTLRYDFFKNYILFTQKEVVYSDVPLTHEIMSDSLQFEGPLRSSRQITVVIDQKKHQLYIVPVSIDGTTLFIGGLTNQQYFNTITHSLSPYTYTIIAFLIILLVVAMPYFKLYFITEKERLNTWDAIFSFLVLLFGSAFLVVMLIYYLQQQGPEAHLRVEFLKSMAQNLENNFKNEIGDIIDQIQMDEEELINSGNHDEFAPWKYDRHLEKTSDSNLFSRYANYNAITWINSSAGQIAKWNIHNITARVNTSKRNYFTQVKNGNFFSDTGFSKQPFYIESIYSQTEGKHYAIVSKKSAVRDALVLDKDKIKMQGDSALYPSVVMVATQLQSLSNKKLPDHISYMVIDASGNVLFHRNPRKQLQENFLEETNYNHVLNDCLHAHTSNHFVSNYDTHRRLFYVNPIGQLPIYLVTYLDFEYERLVDVQILGLTSALYLGLFFLIILIIGLFVYADYEPVKKIKSYNLFFKWFWPNRLKRSLYVLLSVFILLSISLFIIGDFFHSVSMTYSFFMLLIVTLILCLRQFKTWKELFTKPSYVLYFVSFYVAGFVAFFYSLQVMNIHFIWGLLYVLLIAGSIFLSYKSTRIKLHLLGSKPTINFNIFVFLIVVVLGVVPVISFFKRAFDYEKELYIKNIQLNLAEQFKNKPASEKFMAYQSLKFDDTCFLRFCVDTIDSIPTDRSDTNENKTPLSAFMQNFRLGTSSSFFTSHHLNEINNSSDRPFFWRNDAKLLELFVRGNPNIKISSGMINLNRHYMFNKKLTPWQLLAVFTILFVIFLMLINRLVVYWTRRIFLLGLLPAFASDLDASLKELKHHTLIISASFTEGVNYLKRHYKKKKHLWVDLTNPTPHIHVDNVIEIIERNKLNYIVFADYKPFDKEIISEKIKWIKTILAYNTDSPRRVRILIVTPYLPVHMDSIDDPDEPYMVRKYLETVSGFKKSYYPLGFENRQRLASNPDLKKLDKKLIEEVLYMPAFELETYRSFLNKQSKDAQMDRNDMILYIQSSEQMLYHSLWNNCTIQEQYLIFDLAQDGLLNSKNLPDIYNLLLKGIMVKKNGRLKLFNHSFQNFVLSVISPRQALEIEHEAKMEGGWANSQLPIIMIIFGMLLFLFISQQDIFNYLIGWVTAALGSIPILTRALAGLGGLKVLSSSSKKQE